MCGKMVDNENEGFGAVDAEWTNRLRRTVADLYQPIKRTILHVGIRWWNQPSSWNATTDRRLLGRFVLTGYYKSQEAGGARWQGGQRSARATMATSTTTGIMERWWTIPR